jgi:hypothetical protein
VSALILRWPAAAVMAGMVLVFVAGCVAGGPGYGDDGFGVGYYEPYGVDYGGWDGGYRVGPVHGDRFHRDVGGVRPGPHAYRAAPASRPMPSLPSRGRGGGGSRGGAAPPRR